MLTPQDLHAAGDWVACGQAALAAVLEKSLEEVRPSCPPHRWMSTANMRAALRQLGARVVDTRPERHAEGFRAASWPIRGLALVQLRGPWEKPGAPIAASLQHTHWIGVTPLEGGRSIAQPMIFDVNALAKGLNLGWLPRGIWATHILEEIVRQTKRCTGGWWLRAGIEVSR